MNLYDDWEPEYLVYHAWTGHTLGYVIGGANRRVAEECAWKRWGGLAKLTPGYRPFDWLDREIDVVRAR
jgi:hypothetical protein